ncbi:hypothetical protein VDGE_30159 [Verticillium dahliae]|uniref:Uncharacterized protein n=1 Tax=Verticillium dahliae TaxID=27337 RepID=A0A444S0L8_VERDA|nr:hypothetical protein VDGE_30159 [Verticillium dahliae]
MSSIPFNSPPSINLTYGTLNLLPLSEERCSPTGCGASHVGIAGATSLQHHGTTFLSTCTTYLLGRQGAGGRFLAA